MTVKKTTKSKKTNTKVNTPAVNKNELKVKRQIQNLKQIIDSKMKDIASSTLEEDKE